MKNILIIVFVLGLVLFGASQIFSGKSKPGGIASFFQPGFLDVSGTDVGQKPVSVGPTSENKDVQAKKEEEKPKVEPPLGYVESQLSPFYKQIRINGVNPPDYFGDYSSELTIATDNLKNPADITGWTIRANLGGSIEIPRAVSEFSPYGSNPEGNIILRPSEYVRVYSWKSANGKNFRLNKCTGFLNQSYKFSPSLPEDCPSIAQDKKIITFTGACQDFLRSLPLCKLPSPSDLNRFTGPNDIECRRIADQYTYGSCYDTNRTKTDFLSREWRVWLGGAMQFDPKHDRLILFDKQGLVVDEYVY
ncbi:hypothetical protein C4565_06560 [Candidatus Parcubacteria bacterium]|jgi:hypothetical protein|nr:MAG: hypothetical protein C4565_06560 [Candidatus Parcubacteria bacterium]